MPIPRATPGANTPGHQQRAGPGRKDRPHRQQEFRELGLEQALSDRLPIFAGGFPVEAAEQVCADSELPAAEVADLVERLVDRTLLVPEVGTEGQTRTGSWKLCRSTRENGCPGCRRRWRAAMPATTQRWRSGQGQR